MAQKGKILSVPCGGNAQLDISLPAGAMKSDAVLELSAIESKPSEDWIAAGFHLNEKGKSGVHLQVPASICYVTSNELPENTCIVKYTDDGRGYTPVPSQRFQAGGTSGLVAFVESFSSYEVKTVNTTELEQMADEMEKKGFVWVLRVDDKAGFTEEYTDEVSGKTIYEAELDMTLVNTESPTPYVLHGSYRGAAMMRSDAKVTIEDTPIGYTRVEANDDAASVTLHPVFEEYEPEPGSGFPALVGLVPIRYEGSGMLRMKNPKDLGGTVGVDGINLLEVARQMESEWGLNLPGMQEETIPFNIVTEGPLAYVTLTLQGGRSVTLAGSIVGAPKGQKPELAPLVPDKGNNEASTEKSKTVCQENTDGSYDYDIDGDGETDFTLYPLLVNRLTNNR